VSNTPEYLKPGTKIELEIKEWIGIKKESVFATIKINPAEAAMKNKRKAYEERLAANLEEAWDTQLALLKARTEKATAEAKIEYYEITEALERKQDEARKKLQELKAASDGAWEDLKTGAEKAWAEVTNAFHAAATKFK
jgi:uncharacterized LabA/DUF88 family protein